VGTGGRRKFFNFLREVVGGRVGKVEGAPTGSGGGGQLGC